jgi:hypothetical protein
MVFEVPEYNDACLRLNGTMPLVYFDGEHAHRWDGFWLIRESVILGFGEQLERVQLCQAVLFFVIGLIPNGSVGITRGQCLLECRWRRLRLKPFGRDVKDISNDAFFSVFVPDD